MTTKIAKNDMRVLRKLGRIKKDVIDSGGTWDDSGLESGSDIVTVTYKKKQFAFSTYSGNFTMEYRGDIVTEKSRKHDGAKWYDAIMELLYEGLQA